MATRAVNVTGCPAHRRQQSVEAGGAPMSSAAQPAPPTTGDRPLKVVVFSHSPLFYWWPVWAVGFIMAGLTYWFGYPVALVPSGTVAEHAARVEGVPEPRDVLITPAGRSLPAEAETDELRQPRLRMMESNNPGIAWALTFSLVVIITHVNLRGIWSLVVILILIFTTVLLALLGLWDPILRNLQVVDIHLTAFSYLWISLFLFVIWLLSFLFFDRLRYMIFTRGQLRVRAAVGAGETVYDTRGMVVDKHQDDLFRHWLLGFGSGDLTVRTGGSSSLQFEMHNVLFLNSKLALIHTMLQEREVVRGSR
jgi:hypothetical protein